MSTAQTRSNGHSKRAPSLNDRITDASETVSSAVEAASEGVAEKIEKYPYAAVATALGVGYVLGGGLFTKTTARVFELAAKLVMIPAVRGPLLDMAEKAIDSALETKKSDS